MKSFSIGDIRIGPGCEPFIIAEAGINHNGDLKRAREMVLAAKAAKANAIKFQTFAAKDFIQDRNLMLIVCISFVFSRVLSAIAAVTFPAAKSGGTLACFSDHSAKIVVRIVLFIEAALCIGAMVFIHSLQGGILVLCTGLVFLFYYLKCKKELGGITGDTEGFFVVICECSVAVAAAILNVIGDKFLWF